MEINKFSDIRGVVTNESIVEGRMVLVVPSINDTYDFGSRADLPGVKLPDNSTEAALAKFPIAFAVDNRETPIYQPTPSVTFALRRGFDQSANVPFSATVYLTSPGNLVGQTIPSGEPALAFAGGVFTVPSGAFVYNAGLVPGAHLVVANAADDSEADAGKLKYSGTAGVATVERFDSTNFRLTFRTYNP
jgi:hypothetical protein